MLFGLDDVLAGPSNGVPTLNGNMNGDAMASGDAGPLSRVVELEEELRRLQSQFLEYRETVKKTLDDRWNDKEPAPSSIGGPSATVNGVPEVPAARDDDSHYFTSYSYNGKSLTGDH